MSEWISVKDRLPDMGVPVLVWDKDGFAYVDTYVKWGWAIALAENEVTHWMPLPEPPWEENDNGKE